MMPSTLCDVQVTIQQLADDLVESLLARQSFDGIVDFAQHLPVAVVSRLVGLPEEGRQRMLEWASATFDARGVMNDRGRAAVPALLDMAAYAASVERDRLPPGGWAARLFEAADAGRIDAGDVSGMLIDYAGGYLAELEMQSLLRSMVARVRHVEVGEPTVVLNNVLRGYRCFRASFRR